MRDAHKISAESVHGAQLGIGDFLAIFLGMRRLVIGLALVVLGKFPPAVESPGPSTVRAAAATQPVVKMAEDDKAASHDATLTADARLAFIRRAKVWTKTDTPSKNLRTGPGGPGAFEPNEM